MRTNLRIVAFFLCVTLLLGCFCACGGERKGELVRVKEALWRALEDRFSSPAFELIVDSFSEGELSLSVSENQALDLPFDTLSLQTVSSFSQGALLLDADLALNGRSYDAALCATRQSLVLSSQILLGGGALGLSLDSMQSDLAASPLYKDSGSDYSLYFLSALVAERLPELVGGFFDMLAKKEELAAVRERLLVLLLDGLEQHADIQLRTENGRRVMLVKMNNESLALALHTAYGALCADRELCDLLGRLAADYDEIHGPSGKGAGERLQDFLQSDAMINEACDALRTQSPFELVIEAARRRLSRELLSCEIVFSKDGEAQACVWLDFSQRELTQVVLSAKERKLALDVQRSGGLRRTVQITGQTTAIFGAGEQNFSCELFFHVWKKQFSAKLDCAGGQYSLDGTFSFGARRFSLQSQTLCRNGESKPFAVSFLAHKRQRVPDVPDYQSLLGADEATLAPIWERAELVLPSFLADLVTEINETPGLWELLGKIGW